jgi:hypothetical protein
MSFCIVVSRYKEDIEWTKQFSNVIIYNKGTKIENINNEHHLPNVGREGHTYYKYIYDNYENLKDYTIFLQCNPFDHSPDIIDNLNKYINSMNDGTLQIKFEFLSQVIVDCNLSGCKRHAGIPLINVYEILFGETKTDMPFIFGAGAQFIVSKQQILKNSKDFYFKIIKMLQNEVNPIEGFVIERFHKIIFD